MIVSYDVRLVCLSLAVFLMVYMVLGLAVGAGASAAVRAAERMRPRNAARLLVGLRLLPGVVAIFLVIGLCVPSYLWLEQESGGEHIGWLCVTAAAIAIALSANSLAKLSRALVRSARYARHCERTEAPVLMLTGILRPRLVVSRAIRRALSPEQLDVALRHEQAHRRAHDNFKRLLMVGTPRMPGFDGLERAWSRFSEWAADDESVSGDANRALCLADALVRVARLGAIPVASSFIGDGTDLAQRVDRLLHPRTYGPSRAPMFRLAGAVGVAVFVVLFTVVQPLEAAHEFLELLVH